VAGNSILTWRTIIIGVSGRCKGASAHPGARIPSKFTEFVGLTSCYLHALCITNALEYTIFRPKNPNFLPRSYLFLYAKPTNDTTPHQCIPAAKILATPMLIILQNTHCLLTSFLNCCWVENIYEVQDCKLSLQASRYRHSSLDISKSTAAPGLLRRNVTGPKVT